jgi:hypothetical protein
VTVSVDVEHVRARLAAALAANRPGSSTPHVVVALPSFNVSSSLLAHYGDRLAPLEHRYLLSMFMLGQIPSLELMYVTCKRPTDTVIEYYMSLLPPHIAADAGRRFTIYEVSDRTGKPVAAKLLAHPELFEEMRARIGDRPGLVEPWNVEQDEVEVAAALGLPINGTLPCLRGLGFKSAGRRLFREAGISPAFGVEDVHDVKEVSQAIDLIRVSRPSAAGVVIKLDDSAAGDGNVIIRFEHDDQVDHVLDTLPDWYVDELGSGGIVEELIAGTMFSSPSVQVDLQPDGQVVVLATHEQVLGGDNGQVFLGCRFPANPEYAARLAEASQAIGAQMARRGALGRMAIDFAAASSDGRKWDLFPLEMNLRKGGTTHPYTLLRHLVPGRYDIGRGAWLDDEGTAYCYQSSDNLVSPAWTGMSEATAISAVATAGLQWDPRTHTGLVLHMLSGLAIDGRIGATAIAHSPGDALDMMNALVEVMNSVLNVG